eukprot:scaffold1026_cov409-Prasinococcus_capsulatus_cf.AAC.38
MFHGLRASSDVAPGETRYLSIIVLFDSDSKLYDEEFQEYLEKYPDQFRLDYALSREMQNKSGGKMYIQDKVEEYAEEVFDILFNKGGHIYFCGLKGMMPGIQDMLKRVAESKGMDWEQKASELKEKKQVSDEHRRCCG